MARGRRHFFGVVLAGVGIKVISHDRFVCKPHLLLTFHECDVFVCFEAEDAAFNEVVEPVVQEKSWCGLNIDPGALRPITHLYPVSWQDTGDDASVALTPDSFRPNVVWTTDQDDFVFSRATNRQTR